MPSAMPAPWLCHRYFAPCGPSSAARRSPPCTVETHNRSCKASQRPPALGAKADAQAATPGGTCRQEQPPILRRQVQRLSRQQQKPPTPDCACLHQLHDQQHWLASKLTILGGTVYLHHIGIPADTLRHLYLRTYSPGLQAGLPCSMAAEITEAEQQLQRRCRRPMFPQLTPPHTTTLSPKPYSLLPSHLLLRIDSCSAIQWQHLDCDAPVQVPALVHLNRQENTGPSALCMVPPHSSFEPHVLARSTALNADALQQAHRAETPAAQDDSPAVGVCAECDVSRAQLRLPPGAAARQPLERRADGRLRAEVACEFEPLQSSVHWHCSPMTNILT